MLREHQLLLDPYHELSMCFYKSARLWFSNSDREALREAISSCLIPQAVSTRQEDSLREVLGQYREEGGEQGLLDNRSDMALRLAHEVLR